MATDFSPIYALVRVHEKTADRTAYVAVLRPSGCTRLSLRLHSAEAMQPADERYALLLVKTALWLQGGCGLVTEDEAVFRWLRAAYSPQGARAFDRSFMSGVYDRKAAAVIDGETVYTEEVLWQPKAACDLRYHYAHITAALRSAAKHLPRVDAVGFSTAGVVMDGEIRRSGLFMNVPAAEFDRCGRDILQRVVRDVFGAVPCTVCNDGDVAALAGSIALGRQELLGIAMGTSEAGGYVDENGHITGRLNELAFLPVDVSAQAPVDPWSGDSGVGERYFSQEGGLRLAGQSGLAPQGDTPAEMLRWVQALVQKGDERALGVFSELGRMLGLTLPWYRRLLGCRNVLLLGRVISGAGGERLVEACRTELRRAGEEMELFLPEESLRRVGQAAAAALLTTK